MKTTEKETAAAAIAPRRGTGGRGRGRGRGGGGRGRGRGGGGSTTAESCGSGGRGRGGAASGGRGGNHGRHPRQHARPSSNNDHRGGRGRGGNGRLRSSSYGDKSRSDGTLPSKRGPYAHLFCSERHSFALSRVLYPANDNRFLLPSNHLEEPARNQHRIASDAQMEEWWQAVKIVKCRVPYAEDAGALERCPVCLDDEMLSPHIAPCGHTFCLPCALAYLGSAVTELNDESDRIRKNKQQSPGAGRGGVIGGDVATHRASVTTIRARCPMCSSGSSTVLNAGDATITYRDLRPVVFVPSLAIKAISPGEERSGKGKKGDGKSPPSGTRMRFVKLHRARRCPAPYLPVRGHRVRGGASAAASSAMNDLPSLPDGDDDAEECAYARQYFVGAREYEDVLRRNLDDLNDYRNNTMYCKLDPKEEFNVSMAIKAVQAAQGRWIGSGGDDGGFRRMELEGREAAAICERMGRLLVADTTDEMGIDDAGTNERKKSTALLPPGSFYLDQRSETNSYQGETEEFLYYQASDGQPCFLSGINVACLMHEFSLHESSSTDDAADAGKAQEAHDTNEEFSASESLLDQEKATRKPRKMLPLPDELTATVVEVEELTVTASLIKRKPFLSHIPLNSLVSFAEIDWYSGGDMGNRPMLSRATLDKFRGELQRRRTNRMRAAKREERADRAARARSEKDERRRRRELLGRHYSDGASPRQAIDPNDDFFRASSASFGESEEAAPRNRPQTFRFNEVCATGGVWPDLAPTTMSPGRAEKAATSSPGASSVANSSPGLINNTWQGRVHSGPEPKAVISSFPSLAESSLLNRKPEGNGKRNNSHWGFK